MYIDEQPNREAVVRQVAYQIYELRGREEGHALDDWLAAEHSFQAEVQRTA